MVRPAAKRGHGPADSPCREGGSKPPVLLETINARPWPRSKPIRSQRTQSRSDKGKLRKWRSVGQEPANRQKGKIEQNGYHGGDQIGGVGLDEPDDLVVDPADQFSRKMPIALPKKKSWMPGSWEPLFLIGLILRPAAGQFPLARILPRAGFRDGNWPGSTRDRTGTTARAVARVSGPATGSRASATNLASGSITPGVLELNSGLRTPRFGPWYYAVFGYKGAAQAPI